MTTSNKQALHAPIIGRVVELIDYVFRVRTLPCKDIQNVEVVSLRKLCDTLYEQAMNEVRGRDYLKRATETLHAIQAKSYLIYHLHGWSNKVAANIDARCDEIAEQLYKIGSANRQNHEVQGRT